MILGKAAFVHKQLTCSERTHGHQGPPEPEARFYLAWHGTVHKNKTTTHNGVENAMMLAWCAVWCVWLTTGSTCFSKAAHFQKYHKAKPETAFFLPAIHCQLFSPNVHLQCCCMMEQGARSQWRMLAKRKTMLCCWVGDQVLDGTWQWLVF